jgi:hypothetical protein
MSGFWSTYRVVSSEADQCFDPVVVQTDSSPESQTSLWTFYTAGRRDTTVRDLQYSISWDGGQDWAPGLPFGDPFRDEQQADLAADWTGPNGYVSLCYRRGSRQSGDSTSVYWTYANAYNLNDWQRPVKINRYPVAGLAPKLVYAPHSPMRIPGALYSQQVETGPWGVWFTAPWLNADSQAAANVDVPTCWPNPAAATVHLSVNVTRPGNYTLAVYDASGRLVIDLFRGRLEPGPQFWTWNRSLADRARVPAGTYFARLVGPGLSTGHRLVLL